MELFAASPSSLQQARLRDYNAFLVDRDGELSLDDMTLSLREASIQRFEARPQVVREIDREAFERNYARLDTRNPPSEEMLLLLALVKANAAEAYGVSRARQRALDRALSTGDECELRILCEEGYHTRILLSATKLYGFDVELPYVPPTALRIFITGIASMPMAIARPLTLAGEIIATIMFINLLQVTRRVLKRQPELRDAIEERLLEICVDERGHISFNRLHMNAAALAQTRLILPTVAKRMAAASPELAALGAYPRDVLGSLPMLTDPKRMPEAVWRDSFIA